MGLPLIIQGGMGAGVSGWQLARAVSACGQRGVVSGTALDHFPVPAMAERIWDTYFVPDGRPASKPYRPLPLHEKDNPPEVVELFVVSNFVEVWLAREGHGHPVGINYLEKIQLPHLPSIYGAMLAGVDYVLMGAGIPLKIPGVLDRLALHEAVTYALNVSGAVDGDDTTLSFRPRDVIDLDVPPLARPRFLAIISSNVLALTLMKKANGTVDGFVVEGPAAGGHNAPPRGKLQLSDSGEVVYGERDVVDLDKLRALGAPFWLAGGYGSRDQLQRALDAGAAGVQVGTAFAFCEESGLRDDYKRALIDRAVRGEARVFTDPLASPTAFPFKVAQLEGTLSDRDVYDARLRVCDLGYLREAFRQEDGSVGFRCSGEPVAAYLAKGGAVENTIGRKCVCNGLLANIGQAQVRGRADEPGLITAGDDIGQIARFLSAGAATYSAADVIAQLLPPNAAAISAASSGDIVTSSEASA